MSWLDNFASAQKKSDFAIEITDKDWDSDWPSLVSKQTRRVEMFLVERKLVFWLRQTAKGVIQDVLFHVLEKEHAKIDHICITPGKQKGQYEYHFKDGVVVSHKVEFDYGDDTAMEHVVTVQFEEVELKTPAADRRHSVTLKAPAKKQQLNG